MTIKERIEEDAMITLSNDINLRSADYNQKLFIEHYYVMGAKSERNKTIDEAIDIVTDYQDYNPLIIERLKAMKI